MSLFDWLLVTHLVGDFVLQTNKMAGLKATQWAWTLRHVGVYLIGIGLVIGIYSVANAVPVWLGASALMFIGVTHALLDRRWIIRRLMVSLGRSDDPPWLPIIVDQVMHLLTLAVAAQFLALLAR